MSENMVKVPVIRYTQGGIPMYVGKMKAREIIGTSRVDEFSEEHLDAYQRRQYPERIRDIADFVSDCPIPIIPPVLASLREGAKFVPNNGGDTGILEIPQYEGAIMMVDGGHRTGGFKEIENRIAQMKIGTKKISEEEASNLEKLLDFEIPIAFLDAKEAAKRVNQVLESSKREDVLVELKKTSLEPKDIESIYFFVINKTQKSIRPSLKDTLMYQIAAHGIRGIPIIEKEMWRAETTPLVFDLNFEESPLKGMINISGARGLGRPIQLASFVTSLEKLMKQNLEFRKLSREDRTNFIKEYWSTLKDMYPNAFREDLRGDYLILRSLGVYTLNWLANNVYSWCLEEGITQPSKKDIAPYLSPLMKFDWTREKSLIAAYGGMRGIKEAHTLMLAILARGGIEKADQTLRSPSMKLSPSDVEQLYSTADRILSQ